VRLSDTRRAWQSWQEAAGPWQGWSVCPALLAPESADITPRASPRPATDQIAASLATGLERRATALILDLEPVLAVGIAARLNQRRLANAVLLLPRWPYQHAILPVDELLHILVSQATLLTGGQLVNVAFVLDAERNRPIAHRSRQDKRADNRYRLNVADLPNLAALRARGIDRVVKVCAA